MLAHVGFFVYFCHTIVTNNQFQYGKRNRKCESLWSEA